MIKHKVHEATIHDRHKKIPNLNTSESKEHKCYNKEINATMKASIHSEDRFYTKR
jgi:hypothetical protein